MTTGLRPGADPPGGVALDRLLTVHRIDGAQRRVLAADVRATPLGADRPSAGTDAAAGARVVADAGRAGPRAWVVGADGRARRRLAAGPPDRASVVAALDALSANPDRPDDPDDQDDQDGAAARRRLGLAVAALGAVGDRAIDHVHLQSRPVGARARGRPTRGDRARRAWSRTWPWLVAVGLVVGIVTGETALFGTRIAAQVAALHHAGGAPIRTTPAGPAPAPMPAPAAPADGALLGVGLRPLAPPCHPGAPCQVRILVRLAPAPASRIVAWTVQAIDRCGGATAEVGRGTVDADPPGAVHVVATAALPPARSLAVTAVATLGPGPARVASAPLAVGTTTC